MEDSLSQIGRWFGLSEQRGHGVSCDENGVFVGAVPLVEPCHGCAGLRKFRPRPLADLNRELSKRYGMPLDLSAKTASLAAIAQALSRGDILHARIATLHLEIPDPPSLAKAVQSITEVIALAKELRASGLLKADWDPEKHPRWPAGSPDSTGGRFAPSEADLGATLADESSTSTRTAQAGAIPIPFEAVAPRGPIPWPSEIVPPLSIYPRRELVNPFPDDPESEQE
jgi:hypothetical protein